MDEILSTENSGVALIDGDRKILTINAALVRMLGYEDSELKWQDLQNLFADLLPQVFPVIFKVNAKTKTGQLLSVQVEVSELTLPAVECQAVLLTDLSKRQKQRERMALLNSNLERIVEQRTKALKETIENLEVEIKKRREAEYRMKESFEREKELSELKTKFLSMVSHEFKTPLSAILTSATLAEKYTREDQQDKRDKHLTTIKSKVKYLNNILNDFLSIQRLESGKIAYTLDDFPLSRVINKVIYDSNMLSKEGQQINYPEGIESIMVHYDEKILETALTNLINNSIKYSPEDSVIDVRVTVTAETLTIHVSDQGAGIPESEKKFIFNPYFRARNVLTNQGTGIGLNIVKGHLSNLNSSISFESVENKGSTFSITIPYHPKD